MGQGDGHIHSIHSPTSAIEDRGVSFPQDNSRLPKTSFVALRDPRIPTSSYIHGRSFSQSDLTQPNAEALQQALRLGLDHSIITHLQRSNSIPTTLTDNHSIPPGSEGDFYTKDNLSDPSRSSSLTVAHESTYNQGDGSFAANSAYSPTVFYENSGPINSNLEHYYPRFNLDRDNQEQMSTDPPLYPFSPTWQPTPDPMGLSWGTFNSGTYSDAGSNQAIPIREQANRFGTSSELSLSKAGKPERLEIPSGYILQDIMPSAISAASYESTSIIPSDALAQNLKEVGDQNASFDGTDVAEDIDDLDQTSSTRSAAKPDRSRKRNIEATARKKEQDAYGMLLAEVQKTPKEMQRRIWELLDPTYRPKGDHVRERSRSMSSKQEFPRANLMAFAAVLLAQRSAEIECLRGFMEKGGHTPSVQRPDAFLAFRVFNPRVPPNSGSSRNVTR